MICKLPRCQDDVTGRQIFCRESHKDEYHRLERIEGAKVMNKKRIHAATIDGSKRLQRVAKFLGDGLPHSTRDIILACDVCAVNSIVQELRDPKNGFVIVCKQIKNDRWEYTMTDGFENLERIKEVS